MFGFVNAKKRYRQEVDDWVSQLLSAFPDEIKAPAIATVDMDGITKNLYSKQTPARDGAVIVASDVIGVIIDRMSHDFRAESKAAVENNSVGHPFHTCLCRTHQVAEAISDGVHMKYLFAMVSGKFEGYPHDVIVSNWTKTLVNDITKMLVK